MSHLNSPTQPIKFRTHGNSQRLFDLDRNLRHTRLSPYFVLLSGKGLGKQAANSSDCQDILSVSFLPSTLSLSLIVWAFKRTLSCVMLLIVCAYSVHSLGEKNHKSLIQEETIWRLACPRLRVQEFDVRVTAAIKEEILLWLLVYMKLFGKHSMLLIFN